VFEEWRSDNFTIGLTNVSPNVTAPIPGNYAVCGQYPGPVTASATVNLKCTSDMPAYRYLIVQFPSADNAANLCELEVYIRRKCFLVNVNMSSPVRLSSVCLSSLTFVRHTQTIKIFGNVSSPFGTLAIR